MDAAVLQYCNLGLAPATNRVYKSAVNRFSAFCAKYKVTHPFPVDELLLCRFIASLAREGLSPATIKTYLAGVRHAQIMRGLPEPKQTGSMARLKLVQAGVARDRLNRGISSTDRRLPITARVLSGLISHWATPTEASFDPAIVFDNTMLKAAATLCFFGFFRSGEITVPSTSAFEERRHLAWGDIAVDQASPPAVVRVHLKRSKCDQLGHGVDVFVGRTGTALCPVTAILAYVKKRGPRPGSFFRRHDGTPLTKAFFIAKVREALILLGLDPRQFAGHSFRIGAATSAAQAGLEDSIIQALGRWSSSAFLRYVRMPKDHLATYSRQLAATNRAE